MNANYHEGELAEAIKRTINIPQELEIVQQSKSNYKRNMFQSLKKIKGKYQFCVYPRSRYHTPSPPLPSQSSGNKNPKGQRMKTRPIAYGFEVQEPWKRAEPQAAQKVEPVPSSPNSQTEGSAENLPFSLGKCLNFGKLGTRNIHSSSVRKRALLAPLPWADGSGERGGFYSRVWEKLLLMP